ncbi:sensor histidine kinase [Streptomyces sporangiiformans]|uniref:histidine kinase n=2 Tax=Streptomyces sporangiiformans TaxID=2315329 RepID=A0A505D608_9ACTN|nr:sensor histidine kinase [Streptomyces sporangiiformans]
MTAALKDPTTAAPGAAGAVRGPAGAVRGPAGAWHPAEPQLLAVQRAVEEAVGVAQRRAAAVDGERRQAVRALASMSDDLRKAMAQTLPTAVRRLGEGASLETVRAELRLSQFANAHVRELVEAGVRELAVSERRSAAAQAASAKALSRVQAQAVSILADLRGMQDRHGEAVLGDLLELDHSTSQLGLLTDRLALLMGGRASRSWNKPIPMESVLRGAVGRIAAYRRVRINCSSNAAVSGFAAEGVMHLLAELMDNATSFSAPIDQVHVYVEERSAGIVVTVEDSGLKMADAALRRAEEAVSGAMSDLASLQGTRLGLAVVGRLAVKYGISVSYRPSSRGGTGVVVHLPAQLLAQQRTAPRRTAHELSAPPLGRAVAAAERTPSPRSQSADAPPSETTDAPTAAPAPAPAAPSPTAFAPAGDQGTGDNGSVTANGLPVRPPGRTMAAADRARTRTKRPADDRPTRDAGKSFGAFHRARLAAAAGEPAPSAEPAPSSPPVMPSPEPALPSPEPTPPSPEPAPFADSADPRHAD